MSFGLKEIFTNWTNLAYQGDTSILIEAQYDYTF